jgi:hypothetical protein
LFQNQAFSSIEQSANVLSSAFGLQDMDHKPLLTTPLAGQLHI